MQAEDAGANIYGSVFCFSINGSFFCFGIYGSFFVLACMVQGLDFRIDAGALGILERPKWAAGFAFNPKP